MRKPDEEPLQATVNYFSTYGSALIQRISQGGRKEETI